MSEEHRVEMNGKTYVVRLGSGEPRVWVVVNRSPVNPRGFYQAEVVWRAIKSGSRNHVAAWKLAIAKAQAKGTGA